ncbi:hypothetical protein AGMMS50239_38780 [Bacteroidia bacterium]|nr:hypothetical protein AGMMS50239_38780 [Bacteroidia bacterium]
MGVGLYTSRVVLSVLGVEDFGIYGVVGGIVAMFGFLNASMSGATSRFLTFALGKNDKMNLQKTFSSALTIHFLIAIIILILAETIGLWFLENKLVIPEYRMVAARWVYQFSILNSIILITQVPYNSTIIAHERMNVYAYVEILNVCLKLGIVYLLVIGNFDKLILYSALILFVSISIAIIYGLYCLKHFEESKYKFGWDKKTICPMLSFSGWDLYGNMSTIARTQGVNMLLNMFFGPVLNAANGVAVQVQGAIMSFAGNIITAVRPQIVKSYAAGDYQYTIKLIFTAAKYIYLLLLVLSLPLILEMDFVLNLWLKNVPNYAVSFCRLTLIFNFFATLSLVIVCVIHATGKIKLVSLINGTIYLSVIPVSYIAFRFNASPELPYICNILFVFIGMSLNIFVLKRYLPEFSIRDFVLKVFGVCAMISLIAFGISYGVMLGMAEGFVRFCTTVAVSSFTVTVVTYATMDKQTKQQLKTKIQRWTNW